MLRAGERGREGKKKRQKHLFATQLRSVAAWKICDTLKLKRKVGRIAQNSNVRRAEKGTMLNSGEATVHREIFNSGLHPLKEIFDGTFRKRNKESFNDLALHLLQRYS